MKTIKLFFVLLAAIVLTSCEDVVQIELDKGEPILTVDAFINNMRSVQKIRLTYADDYFSQAQNYPVTGASVSIKDLTSGLSYYFSDSNGDGNYLYSLLTNDTLGKIGHTYELTVIHQNNVFKATSRMKRSSRVDSLVSKFDEGGGLGNTPSGYKFAFLGFDVIGDTTDYYWIKSFRNGVFFNKGADINICIDGTYGTGADGFLFIPPIAEGITPRGELFQKFDVCRVEIHSIDFETYNFLAQVQAQTTNSGLFATSPENIKTNITNTTTDKVKVVGWFSMSAVGFKEAVAQ